jgi:acyl-CoA synthetase (AMP-forming)/AMP-acid ligase II
VIEVTTIGDLLLRAAERWPDRQAVVFPETSRTYAELAEGARRVARGLHALGVRRGEHVGLLMPNCIELVEAIFGVALLGAVLCPLNARYRSAELGYVVENADHVVLLTSDVVVEHVDYVPLLHEALPGLAETGRSDAAPKLRHVVLLGEREAPGFLTGAEFARLADTVAPEELEPLRARVRVRDPGVILTTSGTTANPKGCVLTHEAIVRGSRAVAERERVTEDDVCWDPLPLFHTSGLQPLLYVLDRGGRFVCMTHFEPGAALAQIRAQGATLVKSTFPPVTMALVNHPDFASLDVSRIRLVQLVAPPDTLRIVQRAFPHAAIQGAYGLCEGGGYVAVNELDETDETRLQTEGPPFPGIEVRVVDPDTGADVPPGTPGELLLRGFTLFEGYYGDPQRTREVLDEDGWLHTGDRGSVDADGRIRFLGRLKEMIRVGGENVGPAEIEGFLSTHPAVHLVQAVGVPDPRLDEVPAVFVELKPGATATEAELIEYCRGKIASFKVPRYVRFVTEWPMSATKIQRFRLREQLLRELGLEVE